MCCFIMGHTLLSHSSFVKRDVGGLNFISQIGLGFDKTMKFDDYRWMMVGRAQKTRTVGTELGLWALVQQGFKKPKERIIYIYIEKQTNLKG